MQRPHMQTKINQILSVIGAQVQFTLEARGLH